MRFKINLPPSLLSALLILVILGNLPFAVEGMAVIAIVIVTEYFICLENNFSACELLPELLTGN